MPFSDWLRYSLVSIYLSNGVFLLRNYRLIVAPRKFDVLETNMLVLRAASPKYQLDLEIAKKSNFFKLAQNEALRALVTKISF